MVFDMLLGMGKLPRVTSDVTAINPLNLYLDDVTGLAVPKVTLGNNTTLSGSILNVLNPNFDYTNNLAFQIEVTVVGPETTTILLDLGKALFLRGTTIFYGTGGTGTEDVTTAVSVDGTNFTTLKNINTNGDYTDVHTDQFYRYLRMTIAITGNGVTPSNFELRTIQLKLDSKQLLT